MQQDDNINKRTILSQTAKLFDALGFFATCTISRFFYQQLRINALKLNSDETEIKSQEIKDTPLSLFRRTHTHFSSAENYPI